VDQDLDSKRSQKTSCQNQFFVCVDPFAGYEDYGYQAEEYGKWYPEWDGWDRFEVGIIPIAGFRSENYVFRINQIDQERVDCKKGQDQCNERLACLGGRWGCRFCGQDLSLIV
jgi:hypothetical protein